MELTTFVLIALALAGSPEATEAAAQQTARTLALDDALDRYQRRLLTPVQREQLGTAAAATKIIVERKVTLRWEFP